MDGLLQVPYPRSFKTSPLPHQHTTQRPHNMPPPPEENKQASAQVAVDLLWEISQILVSNPPGLHARPSAAAPVIAC